MGTDVAASVILGSLLTGPFIAKDRDVVLSCSIPGDPLSKQRPRWNRKTQTVYTPTETRLREDGIAAIARAQTRELVTDDTALFSVRAGFYLRGHQARDVDNMLKLICDALTGVVWQDDRQVVEVFGFKVTADRPGEARTEIAVCRMPGALPGVQQCAVCSRSFRQFPSRRYRLYCSRACFRAHQRRRVTLTCVHCSRQYEGQAYYQMAGRHFCSKACQYSFGQAPRTCVRCGATFVVDKKYRKQTCSRACAVARGWRLRGVTIRVESKHGTE